MLRHRHLRRAAKILLDLGILAAAFCLAFLLRFEGSLPGPMARTMCTYLPFVVVGKLIVFGVAGNFRLGWRYTSLRDALSLLKWSVPVTALLLCWRVLGVASGLSLSLHGAQNPVPVGVILLDLALSFLGLAGVRAAVRLLSERRDYQLPKSAETSEVCPIPTLLIGAGRAGVMVANEIAARRDIGILPVGFLDDDPNLSGIELGGVPVLGTISQLDAIVRRFQVQQALITIAHRSGVAIRRIVQLCEASGIATKIIPSLSEIVEGRINLSRIRKVDIEDLLRRDPVSLDSQKIHGIVHEKTVLVTGAGGSIGSELCRLISREEPGVLVLVERAENSLFHIHRELVESFPSLRIVPSIADICDEERMEGIFSEFRPSLVLHAAAHKHVPMMEWNPCEAVKNNVLGTRSIATLSHTWDVDRFVMISTDKAVNPTSVMGVSKRVAELLIQAFAQKSTTRFMTVRFGNVLGSAGSVVPIFQQQIAKGGPVTVTHPEMKRYIMTIPEACQLVLQAGCMGTGGEIFILDMGEPVKIVDIARDLIKLSGLVPDHDVEIRFTGIRPGEKLFEELFLGEEHTRKTQHPRIFIGQGKVPDWIHIDGQVSELGELAQESATEQIYAKCREIVPEYQYQHLRHDGSSVVPIQPMHRGGVEVAG